MCNKDKMFGEVEKIKATGDYKPKREDITKPFAGENSIIFVFCRGCGNTFELSRKVAEEFARKASEQLPGQIEPGMYFEVEGCEVCDGGQESVLFKDFI